MKPIVVFRKPKGCPSPIPPATVGILIIEYRADSKRVAQSTRIKVRYDKWNAEARRIRGNSVAVDNANSLLLTLYDEADSACVAMRKAKVPAVPARAKQLAASDGQLQADETLLQSWQAWHAHQLERAAVGEIQSATAHVPVRRRPLLDAWLSSLPDVLYTKDLNAARCRDFARWLLAHYPTVKSRSFANKCARLLSECAACAVERRALTHHPTGKLKLPKAKKKPLVFLTENQLMQLATATFASPKHRRTRDAFLLICYTGFAHVDARAFRPEDHIRADKDGLRWVLRPRQKSDEDAHIALLPQAEALLARYAHVGGQVPVASNQKMNERLHEIEALLQFPFSLTCHVGRRTCGMLLLDAGMSMEAVSKWLGHSSIRMTESIYAHVQQRRIGRELRENGLLPPAPDAP